MASRMKPTIDYKTGLRKTLKIQFPSLKFDTASSELIGKVLNEINDQLIAEFNKEYAAFSSGVEKPCQLFAQKAVERVFKGSFKKHAVAEAQRQLTLYETGCMKYDWKSETEKAKSKTAKTVKKKTGPVQTRSPETYFRLGIAKMARTVHPDLILNKEAKILLCQQLSDFTRMVGEKIGASETRDILEPDELRAAVAEFLGPEVMRIANCEGSRSLLLYVNGLISSKLKPAAPKEDPNKFTESFLGKSFRPGIRSFLSDLDKDASIGHLAAAAIEEVLIEVTEFLTSYVAEVCQVDGVSEMGDTQVQDSVTEVFPGNLQEHALIQGSADVMQYNAGFLKYKRRDPVSPQVRKVKRIKVTAKKVNRRSAPTLSSTRRRRVTGRQTASKAKGKVKGDQHKLKTRRKKKDLGQKEESISPPKTKKIKLDFTTALLDLGPSLFPDLKVTFNKDSTKAIGEILNDACHTLINQSNAEKNGDIVIGNIKKTVKDIFPKELAQHAVAFGMNVVAMNCADEPMQEESS